MVDPVPCTFQDSRGRRKSSAWSAAVVLAVALGWLGTASAPASRAPGLPPRHGEVVGRSVDGRAIRAVRIGPPGAARRLLIVACVHGDEPAGEAITRRLRFVRPPADTSIWVIDRANPDGCAAGTRKNARGVDLNRNSPWHWAHINGPGGVFYSGPRAWSEPESRRAGCLRRARPSGHHDLVPPARRPGRRVRRRRRQHRARLRAARRDAARALGLYRGSFTGWQNTNLPGTTAFVVEFQAGAVPAADVKRHVSAVLALARR